MNGPGITSQITLLGDPAAIAAAWEARDTEPFILLRAAHLMCGGEDEMTALESARADLRELEDAITERRLPQLTFTNGETR